MSEVDKTINLRSAYNKGAMAARKGTMLTEVPFYESQDLYKTWQKGWTDAAIHIGMILEEPGD